MAQEPIVLRVPGTPAPQGSKSAFIVWPKGGKPRAIITDGKRDSPGKRALDAWRGAIEAEAAAQSFETLEGPVRVRVIFYLRRPPSYPRWRWLSWQKPDLDKLCRSTLDALTAAKAYGDDGQVAELAARKVLAIGRPTGALIRIEPLDEEGPGHAWLLTGGRPPRLS